jgi:aspartate ammonia-lyase
MDEVTSYRTEKDLLGTRQIPADALWGIHTLRAMENFPLAKRPVHESLVRALGAVKSACAQTNRALGYLPEKVADGISAAAQEMLEGKLSDWVVVDALQGGAGTSTNMNVNEVIANRALLILGEKPGHYDVVHPIAHVNLHQSTNDVYPTALKVAAINLIRRLEQEIIALTEAFQRKEAEFAGIVKVGRTEMQAAVLTTLGREMSAYADAFARDRWRIYKCEERLRVVNLGGTAIGTGITTPRDYIFKVAENLKNITGIGIARAENLVEATQNADVFVEVSGILKACAASLLKCAGDLRLLSSSDLQEINLPPRQAGSSIMPDKVNPVIPEAVSQAALQIMANDQAITIAAASGNLELNAFLPLIAENLLGSLELAANAAQILRQNCVDGMTANPERCRQGVEFSTAIITALVDVIGYEKAEAIAEQARKERKTIREVVLAENLLSVAEFEALISPERVNRLGSKPVGK